MEPHQPRDCTGAEDCQLEDPPVRDDELDKELQFHLDERVADLLRTGITEEEARRRARLELGGVMQTKEAVRDHSVRWLIAELWQDGTYAIRSFCRQPGF